jgi:hypothetical protein
MAGLLTISSICQLKQKAPIKIKTAEVAFRVLAFADLHATLRDSTVRSRPMIWLSFVFGFVGIVLD